MIKLRIEATDLLAGENEIDAVEIIDADKDSNAAINVYFDIFCRALTGLSFSKEAIVEYMEHYVELEIDTYIRAKKQNM